LFITVWNWISLKDFCNGRDFRAKFKRLIFFLKDDSFEFFKIIFLGIDIRNLSNKVEKEFFLGFVCHEN